MQLHPILALTPSAADLTLSAADIYVWAYLFEILLATEGQCIPPHWKSAIRLVTSSVQSVSCLATFYFLEGYIVIEM